MSTADRELTLTRIFDAPRPLVFAAFVDPVHLPSWWGPKGFTTRTISHEARVGGAWRFTMTGPDGKVWGNRIVYETIEPPTRLTYLHGEDLDEDPSKFHVTITFEELPGRTRVTMCTLLPTAAQREAALGFGAVELGRTTLDKCAAKLHELGQGRGETVMTRRLAAPPALVWRAITEPAQLARWWGPHGFTLPACVLELRVGGRVHLRMQAPDGSSFPVDGEVLDLVPGVRLVHSSRVHGEDLTNTTHLVADGDGTLLTVRQTWPLSATDPEGQAEGFRQSLDRLVEALATTSG